MADISLGFKIHHIMTGRFIFPNTVLKYYNHWHLTMNFFVQYTTGMLIGLQSCKFPSFFSLVRCLLVNCEGKQIFITFESLLLPVEKPACHSVTQLLYDLGLVTSL